MNWELWRLVLLPVMLAGVLLAAGPMLAQEAADEPDAVETAEGEAPPVEPSATEDAGPDDAPADTAQADASEDDAAPGAFARFYQRLAQAGWIGVVLIALSIFAIAVAIERFVNLRQKAIVPDGLAEQADRLVQQGQFDRVRKLCQEHPSTLGRIIEGLLDHREVDAAEARTITDELGSGELKLHQQRTYFLAVAGSLAPLLGLLGTVVGMIAAFETIAAVGEMGDPGIFAQDIGMALMTTAMGLVVAIPVLALNHWFKSRIARCAVVLEQQTTELIRRWFTQGKLAHAAKRDADASASSAAQPPRPATPQPASAPTQEPSHVR